MMVSLPDEATAAACFSMLLVSFADNSYSKSEWFCFAHVRQYDICHLFLRGSLDEA